MPHSTPGEEWFSLREWYDRLADMDPRQRRECLQDLRRQNPKLHTELEALLDSREKTSFLEQSVVAEYSFEQQRLGPYHLQKQVGRGGMGSVYQARRVDGAFDMTVAVKVIAGVLVTDEVRRRFQREREILAKLDHPHIARLLDGGTTADGQPFFVMEFVAGGRIDEYARNHKISLRDRLNLFLQVCQGIEYAHRHLIVHRDLKPGNILVTADAQVKLLDFGIAKALTGESAAPPESQATSQLWLTPDYSAPEQIANRTVTTATDVYQLGLLLFELLSGQHPFRRKNCPAHELMRAVCEDDPPQASEVLDPQAAGYDGADARRAFRDLKGDLDQILSKSLRKEPADRYASVGELRRDLERYLHGKPVLARGQSIAYRSRKYVRRNWTWITAAALIAVSLIGGTWTSLTQAAIARKERAEALSQRQHAMEERVNAERQRALAAQRLEEAVQARAEAERRMQEVERQKRRAQQQEFLAMDRYRDLRGLVATLLFDTHDRIMNLAGSVEARKIVLDKARDYLEKLLKDHRNDPGLLDELAGAYERLGFLESESSGPQVALTSNRNAVRLRYELLARDANDPKAVRSLALALSRLGESEIQSGKQKEAIDHIEEGLRLIEPLANAGEEAAFTRAYLLTRLCILAAAAYSDGKAEPACREGIALLAPATLQKPGDLQYTMSLGAARSAYGNLLAKSGRTEEGLREIESGLRIYESVAVANPSYAGVRRALGGATVYLAQARVERQEYALAAQAYGKAVKAMRELLAIHPGDTQTAMALAYTLSGFSSQRWLLGDRENASSIAAQASELYRDLAERPGAGVREFNEYALFLAKTEIPQARHPARALEYALRASRATRDANPLVLDTLAWAYYANNQPERAAEASRKALAAIPTQERPNMMLDRLRKEIEENLRRFELRR